MRNYILTSALHSKKSNRILEQLDLSIIDHMKYEKSNMVIADHSKRNLFNIGKHFNQYLKAKHLVVDAASIKGFLNALKLEQASPTWNLSRQNLKKLIKHQVGIEGNYLMRVLVGEIFNEIKPIKTEKQITTFLTSEQVALLISKSNIRTGLVIEFLFKTGCRITELINVRLMDIKCDRQVRIRLWGESVLSYGIRKSEKFELQKAENI